jgi:2-haloacid dehalogenase
VAVAASDGRLDLAAFDALTFDCYGTLIDWERGLAAALLPLLATHGVEASAEEVLALHARFEPPAQTGPYRTYREVLARVVDAFGSHFGFLPSPIERAGLAESIRDWPPFADSAAALRRLGERYRLAILSNIDDDLLHRSVERLEVDFDCLITAQQVRSYKPARGHFDAGLAALGLRRERVLHVAQSLFHDVQPAGALGWSTVWVDRRHASAGSGATPQTSATPDLVVPDLATLADLAA